jgi:hypothetical protein
MEQSSQPFGLRLSEGLGCNAPTVARERAVLFSAPMVRALLGGTKTQTRRLVKPQPDAEHGGEPYWFVGGYRAWTYRDTQDVLRKGGNVLSCPYGQAGHTLWVRETWARDDEDGALMYRADLGRDMSADAWEQGRLEGVPRYRWRPSIHMPRAASRIALDVTGVRVERLNDISEADALAEGVTPKWEPGCSGRLMEALGGVSFRPAASAYADLWEQINGPGSWSANPWVWVLAFRCRPNLQPT